MENNNFDSRQLGVRTITINQTLERLTNEQAAAELTEIMIGGIVYGGIYIKSLTDYNCDTNPR